jgi:hypothetical protein
VQIFDPVAHGESPDGITSDWVNNNGRNNGDRGRTVFRVYAPDATPGDWKDNSTLLCEETFYTKGHALYDASAEDVWYTTCNIPKRPEGLLRSRGIDPGSERHDQRLVAARDD